MKKPNENGLESAATDRALANSETNQKQAEIIMPNFSAAVRLIPSSHAPSLEAAHYRSMSTRQLRRLAAKRLSKGRYD